MLNTVDVIEIAKVTVSVVIKAIELNQENDIELPNKISIEFYKLYRNKSSGIY